MIKTNCVLLLLVIFNSVLSKNLTNEENGYANHRITRSSGHVVVKRANNIQQQFDVESLNAKFTDFIKDNNNNVAPRQQINIESLRGRFSDFIRANSMKPLGPQTGNVIPDNWTTPRATPSTTARTTPQPTPRTPRPTPTPTVPSSSAPIKNDDDEYALYDVDVRFNKD